MYLAWFMQDSFGVFFPPAWLGMVEQLGGFSCIILAVLGWERNEFIDANCEDPISAEASLLLFLPAQIFFSASAEVGELSCRSVLVPVLMRSLPQLTLVGKGRGRGRGRLHFSEHQVQTGNSWTLSCLTGNMLYLLWGSASQLWLQLAAFFIYPSS